MLQGLCATCYYGMATTELVSCCVDCVQAVRPVPSESLQDSVAFGLAQSHNTQKMLKQEARSSRQVDMLSR